MNDKFQQLNCRNLFIPNNITPLPLPIDMNYNINIPLIRITTFFFLIVFFLMAIGGPGNHPWFTTKTLWLAVLFAFCIWLMSLKKDFFLDVMSVLFTAYFTQRILVIYFRPEQMSYLEYTRFSSENFNDAILFCIESSIFILLGYYCAIYTGKKKKKKSINFNRIFRYNFSFERLFKVYTLVLICSLFFKIFLITKYNVGLTALDFSRSYAPLLRLTQFSLSLSLLPIIVIVSGRFSSKIRKKAMLLLKLLILMAVFIDTSKGALLSFCISFFVCFYFCGKRISKKHIIAGVTIFFSTIFLFAPVTVILRAGLIGMVTGSIEVSDFLLILVNNYTLLVEKMFFGFLNRLGGFDWLTGFITVGRDVFHPSASITDEVITIINSLVPGDLILRPTDYVTTSKLIPHILRGWQLGHYPGHNELMGGIGMAYLYFGFGGGTVFFLGWSFISVKLLNSNINIILKVLFFQLFIISFFVAGGFVTPVKSFYEAIILLILLTFLTRIRFHHPVYRFSNLV